MKNDLEKRICSRVIGLKDELIWLLSELISIPTPDPPADNYDHFVQFLSKYMKTLGMKVVIKPASSEGLTEDKNKSLNKPNILAELKGSKNSPVLHFNGHYDVVPAKEKWRFSEPYLPAIKNNRIYGRGSSDMKSGIASMLIAAKAFNIENIQLSGKVVFSFVPDEENDGEFGTKFLVESNEIQADYCIVGEPTGGINISNGHKGCLWMEIIIYGKAAHGATPWMGINAFDKMIDLMEEFKNKLKLGSNDRGVKEANNEEGTVTFGGIVHTGDSINVVPPYCRFSIDRRLGVRENVADSLNEFVSIVDSIKKKDPNFISDIKVLSKYEPCITPLDSKLISVMKESIKSVTRNTPKISIGLGGCDMRYFHQLGIPTAIYGPGNPDLAHQVDEHVEIDSLLTAAQVYALSTIRLLESP